MTVLDGFTCIDCDDDPDMIKCLECNHNGFRSTCSVCAPGYRLVAGECAECTNVGESCEVCNENVCEQCYDGYYLVENLDAMGVVESTECVPCTDTLHHCLTCNGPDVCEVCDL